MYWLVFEPEQLEAREELVSEDDLGSLLELVGDPRLQLVALDEGSVRGRQVGDHHRVVAHLQHGVRAGHRRDGDLERDALRRLAPDHHARSAQLEVARDLHVLAQVLDRLRAAVLEHPAVCEHAQGRSPNPGTLPLASDDTRWS